MPVRPPCNENNVRESRGNEWHPDNIWYPSFHIFSPNVSVQVRRLVRRNLQRLVGAVHLVFWLFHLIPKGKGLADLSPCRLPPDSSD